MKKEVQNIQQDIDTKINNLRTKVMKLESQRLRGISLIIFEHQTLASLKLPPL